MEDHACNCHSSNPSTIQTIEELDFERGLWNACLQGDKKRVQELLKKEHDPNKLDRNGYIPLHYAARAGHEDICELLLEAGSYINVKTSGTLATPLHRAAYAGKLAVVSLLLSQKTYCETDCNKLIEEQDVDGKTCLHKAVEGKRWKVMKCILNKNTQVANVKDKKGKIPFDYLSDFLKNKFQLEINLNNTAKVSEILTSSNFDFA